MIIKANEEIEWERWVKRDATILAKRFTQDFMAETSLGWIHGKSGDWLVELGAGIRFACSDAVFLKSYQPQCEDCVNDRTRN